MDFKTEFFGLSKKIKNARQNGLKFNQIKKLTKKIYSNLSNIKIRYYLKLRIPRMHRHVFKKLFQNPVYVKTHCSDRNNPFHFACRKVI